MTGRPLTRRHMLGGAADRSLVVRALHREAPAAVSNVAEIAVVPAMTLSLVSGSPLRMAGTVQPAKRAVILAVYHRSGLHRHLVLRRRVAVHAGQFSARLSLGRKARGRYEIIARSAADAVTAAGASPPVVVTR